MRVGVIGTGDEGNVLIGGLNPEYVQVTAIADIRPYNIHRAFHGDWALPAALAAREGLMSVYGWKSEDEARKHVKVYDAKNGGYKALLQDPDVEAVIIALPLHLHATAACEAMQAGKHVLTEKLMAHNIAQCKVMGRVANELGLYLSVGHQRHYSVLYDNAVNLLRWGLLGQLHHIRAQWHRGNLPGKDSWQQPLPGGEVAVGGGKGVDQDSERVARQGSRTEGRERPGSFRLAAEASRSVACLERGPRLERGRTRLHFHDLAERASASGDGRVVSLASVGPHGRRLDGRIGQPPVGRLGHFRQHPACRRQESHPLTVHAVGGRHVFPLDRDAEDHVYCMFEFAGPAYEPTFDVGYRDATLNYPDPKKGIPGFDQDPNHKIVVCYSTINGNGFGGYGEVVMGTKGTLVLDREQEIMLYKESDTSSRVSVKEGKAGPTMDTQASGGYAAVAKMAESMGPVSRGYTEEIEHWAWCIRNKAPENQPRCKPEVALGDSVIALGTNVAIDKTKKGEPGFLKFDEKWYDLNDDATPDGSSCEKERVALMAKA